MRLYKAEWVYDAEGNRDITGVVWDPLVPEPEGWAEFCEAKWGEYKPFFWPSTDKIFRSRSSAQARVDIINRWGGKAVLVECTPVWETVEAANARRKAARVQERIERKSQEMLGLMREYHQLTGELPNVEEMGLV